MSHSCHTHELEFNNLINSNTLGEKNSDKNVNFTKEHVNKQKSSTDLKKLKNLKVLDFPIALIYSLSDINQY